jgi:hypothetical protein
MVSGFTELAAGALSGWVYTIVITDRERAEALGIQAPARVRQWHLDLIALGSLQILVSQALPDLPRRIAVPLGVGAWANAMAFGVLAVRPGLDQTAGWRAAIGSAFVTTSFGFTSAAVEACKRRRGRER